VAGTNQPPATGTMIPGYLPNGLGCSGNCTYTGLTGTSYTMAALMSGGSLGVSTGFVGTVSNLNSASPAGSSAGAAQSQTTGGLSTGTAQSAPSGAPIDMSPSSDGLAAICVGPGCAPQMVQDPISGSTFPVPNGTDYQGIFQAGQNFRNNGGTLLGVGAYVGGGGKYNLQNQAAALGLPYKYFQEGANVAVGVFMSGAGFSLAQTLFFGQTYGFLGSTNFAADTTNWSIWWAIGFNDGINQVFPSPVKGP